MRHYRADPQAIHHSKSLRENQTEAETKLWQALRSRQLENIHFRRQHAVGRYIVDFCAPRKKLIVELDGGQHLDQEGYDAERTIFLQSKGYTVLRFWNLDIFGRLDDVIQAILQAAEEK